MSEGGYAGSTYGNRTRHSSVKGRRLNRLTNAPFFNWDCKDKDCFLYGKLLITYFLSTSHSSDYS
jgi:hypothetical protein